MLSDSRYMAVVACSIMVVFGPALTFAQPGAVVPPEHASQEPINHLPLYCCRGSSFCERALGCGGDYVRQMGKLGQDILIESALEGHY